MSDTQAANSFIGSWQLQSWTINYSDSNRVTEPFGKSPVGLIMYTADGWMNAVISRDDRPCFAMDRSLRSLSAESLAAAYTSYFQYSGPYRIEGNEVVHEVSMSLNPNFVGSEQRRNFRFENDFLHLSGEESFNDRSRLHKLVWRSATQEDN